MRGRGFCTTLPKDPHTHTTLRFPSIAMNDFPFTPRELHHQRRTEDEPQRLIHKLDIWALGGSLLFNSSNRS